MIRSASSVYLESLGEQLEVVNERLHGCLHLGSAGGHALGVIRPHVTCNSKLMIVIISNSLLSLTSRHLVEALLHDSQTLPHLCHPHEVTVVTITVAAHGNVKVHQVVSVIGSGLSDVVLDTWNTKNLKHRSTSHGHTFPKLLRTELFLKVQQ